MTEQYPRVAALLSRMSRLRRPSWVDDTFGWAVIEIALEPEISALIHSAACTLVGHRPELDRMTPAEAAVLADRLQAEGDRWGHYLAALMEPKARPELEDEIADLLEGVLDRRARRRLIRRATELGLVEIEGETNAALRLRILGAQSSQSIDSFSRAVSRSMAPAFSVLMRSVQRINARAEKDRARRDHLVRILELDSDEVEADVDRRGHEAVYRDLAAGTWPRHHSTLELDFDMHALDGLREEFSAGYVPPRPVIEEPPRGPGIGPGLARRLRKRGRQR